MNNIKIAYGVALVAILIALFAFFHSSSPSVKLGLADTSCQGFTTCLSDLYLTLTGGGTGSLNVAGSSVLTGTTTIALSMDGMAIGGTIPTTATGTVRTLYTNTTGPKLCDADTGYLYVKNNGSFAPSLVFSMGTSTTAAASTNLVASSTVATTTSTIIHPNKSLFVLAQGDSITAEIGDITNTSASSTYFSNWSAEGQIWCNQLAL